MPKVERFFSFVFTLYALTKFSLFHLFLLQKFKFKINLRSIKRIIVFIEEHVAIYCETVGKVNVYNLKTFDFVVYEKVFLKFILVVLYNEIVFRYLSNCIVWDFPFSFSLHLTRAGRNSSWVYILYFICFSICYMRINELN